MNNSSYNCIVFKPDLLEHTIRISLGMIDFTVHKTEKLVLNKISVVLPL